MIDAVFGLFIAAQQGQHFSPEPDWDEHCDVGVADPFDSQPSFSFPLGAGQVIRGWDQGVAGMRVGGQRRLVIPPELAYGSSGRGTIPPNATLVFDITLNSVR